MKRTIISAALISTNWRPVRSAIHAASQELIQPISPAKITNPALVELGKKLT